MIIQPLAARPDAIAHLAGRFIAEWPDFFAGRSVDEIGRQYFAAPAPGQTLPIVLVAEDEGQVCGTVAIRVQGPETHPGPWVNGLWVDPAWRRHGIGAALTQAVVQEGARQGFPQLFAATATAHSLFRRLGWEELGDVPYHGETVAVFRWRAP